jgi:hypothetical protein
MKKKIYLYDTIVYTYIMDKGNTAVSYWRLRQLIGLLGILLAFLSVLIGLLGGSDNPQHWWSSISATYYSNAGPVMIGLLVCVGMFLITYDPYDAADAVISTVSGISALIIAFFPCSLEAFADSKAGVFHLPTSVSQIIHSIGAVAFFISLACMSLFLFTRTNGSITARKKTRNKIYLICGWTIIAALTADGILTALYANNIIGNGKGQYAYEYTAWGMGLEAVMLTAFGISWLTKGGLIKPDLKFD